MSQKKSSNYSLLKGFHLFLRELLMIVKSPVFLILTLLGNGLISFFSLLFYWTETGINPRIQGVLDAFWWGFATATTTGYGDITPVTSAGKLLGILLMLTGTAIFAMFTALFAETILAAGRQNKL